MLRSPGPDQSVKQAASVTANDAVLAMCAGALRYYLMGGERRLTAESRWRFHGPTLQRGLTPAATVGSAMQSPPIDDPAQQIPDHQRVHGRQQSALRIAAAAGCLHCEAAHEKRTKTRCA